METLQEIHQYILDRKKNENLLIEEIFSEKMDCINFEFINKDKNNYLLGVRFKIFGKQQKSTDGKIIVTPNSLISSSSIDIGKFDYQYEDRNRTSNFFFGCEFKELGDRLSQDFKCKIGKCQIKCECKQTSKVKDFIDKLINLHLNTLQLKSENQQNQIKETTTLTEQFDEFTDIDQHRSEFDHLEKTERESIIQSRIGQGIFREIVIKLWGSCSVTGIRNFSIMRASHIRPWRDSSNEQRLDPYNGLLLIPNLDVLFDQGFISFDENGKIIISKQLNQNDHNLLGINPNLCLRMLFPGAQKYMKYHRDEVFKK